MTKKFYAAAAALLLPAAAYADHAPMGSGGGPAPTVNRAAPEGGYANRGQCQSALMQVRNSRRSSDTASDYNRSFRERYECRPSGPNGGYFVHVVNH